MSKRAEKATPDDAVTRHFGTVALSSQSRITAIHRIVQDGRAAMGLPRLPEILFEEIVKKWFSPAAPFDPFEDAPFRVGLSLRNFEPSDIRILRTIEAGLAAPTENKLYLELHFGPMRSAYLAVVLGSLAFPSIGWTAQALAHRSLLARVQMPTGFGGILSRSRLEQMMGFLRGGRAMTQRSIAMERYHRQRSITDLVSLVDDSLRKHAHNAYAPVAAHLDQWGQQDGNNTLFTPERCTAFIGQRTLLESLTMLFDPNDFQFACWRTNRTQGGRYYFDAPFDTVDAMPPHQACYLLYTLLGVTPGFQSNHMSAVIAANPYHHSLLTRQVPTVSLVTFERLVKEGKIPRPANRAEQLGHKRRWLDLAVGVHAVLSGHSARRLPPPFPPASPT